MTEAERNMEIAHKEHTLWLTPREPLRSALSTLIRGLARDLDAVEFEPHVTVFCGRSSDAEAEINARAIAARFPPIELVADGLGYSDRFTKTLFVQFRDSAVAREMFDAARQGYALPSDYVFNPHLSLLYNNLPQARLKEIGGALKVPLGKYVFDRIQMIETELPIEDLGPVRRWRQVCDF